MKKLLIFLVAFLLFFGCNNSNSKETSPSESEYLIELDPELLPNKTITIMVKQDSNLIEIRNLVIRDSSEIRITEDDPPKNRDKRRIISIKADTSSILPELRKNRKLINEQQEILDSLLGKK